MGDIGIMPTTGGTAPTQLFQGLGGVATVQLKSSTNKRKALYPADNSQAAHYALVKDVFDNWLQDTDTVSFAGLQCTGSDPITIPQSNVWIEAPNTQLIWDGTVAYPAMLTFTGNNVVIRGLFADGKATSFTPSGDDGDLIRITGKNYSLVDCIFQNSAQPAGVATQCLDLDKTTEHIHLYRCVLKNGWNSCCVIGSSTKFIDCEFHLGSLGWDGERQRWLTTKTIDEGTDIEYIIFRGGRWVSDDPGASVTEFRANANFDVVADNRSSRIDQLILDMDEIRVTNYATQQFNYSNPIIKIDAARHVYLNFKYRCNLGSTYAVQIAGADKVECGPQWDSDGSLLNFGSGSPNVPTDGMGELIYRGTVGAKAPGTIGLNGNQQRPKKVTYDGVRSLNNFGSSPPGTNDRHLLSFEKLDPEPDPDPYTADQRFQVRDLEIDYTHATENGYFTSNTPNPDVFRFGKLQLTHSVGTGGLYMSKDPDLRLSLTTDSDGVMHFDHVLARFFPGVAGTTGFTNAPVSQSHNHPEPLVDPASSVFPGVAQSEVGLIVNDNAKNNLLPYSWRFGPAGWQPTDEGPPNYIQFTEGNGLQARVEWDQGQPLSYNDADWTVYLEAQQINAPSYSTGRVMLATRRGGTAGGTDRPGFWLGFDNAGNFNSMTRIQVVGSGGGHENIADLAFASTMFDLNWHSIALTWLSASGTATLYFDGTSRATSTNAAMANGDLTPRNAENMRINGVADGSSNPFPGNVRNVRCYQRVLTPDEISSLHNGRPVPGAASHNPFKRALMSSSYCRDVTGNGRDARNNGGLYVAAGYEG